MPRVHYRKARKDYPAQGIAKGDMYYFTKLKLQRGGMVKRSKTRFKPSQLTNSPFKSGFLAVGEEWEESSKDADAIRAAAEAIREVGNEAQESFDNMPEGLQDGDTGQMLSGRADACETKADELEGLADEWDALEEPVEPEPFDPADYAEEMSDMDPEDIAEFLTEKEQEHDGQYESDQEDYENEVERIQSEAAELIEDMPE